MKERISMSKKELSRLQELQKAHENRQTLAQVADNLGLSDALRTSQKSIYRYGQQVSKRWQLSFEFSLAFLSFFP